MAMTFGTTKLARRSFLCPPNFGFGRIGSSRATLFEFWPIPDGSGPAQVLHFPASEPCLESARPVFVDALGRRAAAVSAKLTWWLKDRKLPAEAEAAAHSALQRLRISGMQIVPNLHQALSVLSSQSGPALALTAIDTCVEALHTLLGVLPTDPRAFSILDDLMTLRDEVEARFPDARRSMAASHDDAELTASGAHRFGR